MAETYTVTFRTPRGAGSVDVTVPDGVEPLNHIAHEIARELDLFRFEVQIGEHGGSIRGLGDDGPGIPFTLTRLEDEPDDPTPCCPDPACSGRPCTFPGYAPTH